MASSSSRGYKPWFGGGRKDCGLEEWDDEQEILSPGERAGVIAKVAPSAWLDHSKEKTAPRTALVVGSWVGVSSAHLFVCLFVCLERPYDPNLTQTHSP